MNHSCRVRLYRLLFLPVLLLGAALLMRARLPRPQTEGDKWLWEQGERATKLQIMFDPDLHGTRRGRRDWSYVTIQISDASGIREVLRSLEGTAAFSSVRQTRKPNTSRIWGKMVARITILLSAEKLYLYPESGRYVLYRERAGMTAPVSGRSVTRFQATLESSLAKAQSNQEGYYLDAVVRS